MSATLDLSDARMIAIQAAREAGRIQRDRGGRAVITSKGAADITTDVDVACEKRITEVIRAKFEHHDVLGEEGAAPERSGRPLWIVDPLDGTKNYAHGYPRSAVSIALMLDARVEIGVVYNAHADELFVAQRGHGSLLNDQAIRVSRVPSVSRSMIATAVTYNGRETDRVQLERLVRVHGVAEAVRSDGCAALDLCDVARGRFEAYFEPGLQSWDTAAGALIVSEAGGEVTNLSSGKFDAFVAEMVASNGLIHRELLTLVG